ncbi:MAG: T9SS type A sorting domain-containing protein [Bacteroidota bacterium]|nr:T9SS type A sorting domain-containing protein [Bacteroidota bacterium]
MITSLLLSRTLSAQEVVAASGTEHVQPNGSIVYTIGEPVINTAIGQNEVLTQGFNQPWASIITEVGSLPPTYIVLYPNPTRHDLHIDIGENTEVHRYEMIDAKGARVLEGRLMDQLTTLDMEPFASGSYVFRLYTPDQPFPYSYKITVSR